MARKPKDELATESEGTNAGDLTKQLAKRGKPTFFQLWIVGDTPLIAHAWSQKAKMEMLAKQVKAVKAAKLARDPETDFVDSLYRMPDGKTYGFPAMAFKKAIVSQAHKDKGIAKTDVMATLWLEAEMIRCYTAYDKAICDMPIIRLHSGPPEMREDMVRIGSGLNKTANLAYRAQFTHWAALLSGRVNTNILPLDALRFLIDEAGFACGIGEWRNEKGGMFGAFHCARAEEFSAWEAFVAGRGPLPTREMAEAS